MIPENLEQYLDKKYVLRSGRVVYIPHKHGHFNNDTLTDSIAETAIKKNPALKGKFLSDRERAVLEAKKEAKSAIGDLEAFAADESLEKEVVDLMDAGELDEARAKAKELQLEESREKALEIIKDAQVAQVGELLKEKDIEGATAMAEALTDEETKVEALQLVDDEIEKLKKAAEDKKKKAAAAKKKAAEDKKKKEAEDKKATADNKDLGEK